MGQDEGRQRLPSSAERADDSHLDQAGVPLNAVAREVPDVDALEAVRKSA
jgi:hypothetical protein